MTRRLRHLDLFSGIGGWALPVRWLGHETVGFCEIDEWSRRVLNKNFPGVPTHDDIKTLKGDQFGPVSIITGSPPCQPFSIAGKRGGTADDRHLWPEMFRVIDEARPTYVLLENTPGIVKMVLDDIQTDLESIGYSTGAIIVPASSVGAPHKRARVWVAGIMADTDTGQRDGEGQELRAGGNATAEGSTGSIPNPNRGRLQTGEAIERGIPEPDSNGDGDTGMADTDNPWQQQRTQEGDQAGDGPLDSSEDGRQGQPKNRPPNTISHGLEGVEQGGAAQEPALGSSSRPQAPRSMDTRPDELPAGLVRPGGGGLGIWDHPDTIRAAFDDGSWEHGIDRTTTDEVDRARKIKAAGNAVLPVLVYELLRELVGPAEGSTS